MNQKLIILIIYCLVCLFFWVFLFCVFEVFCYPIFFMEIFNVVFLLREAAEELLITFLSETWTFVIDITFNAVQEI